MISSSIKSIFLLKIEEDDFINLSSNLDLAIFQAIKYQIQRHRFTIHHLFKKYLHLGLIFFKIENKKVATLFNRIALDLSRFLYTYYLQYS